MRHGEGAGRKRDRRGPLTAACSTVALLVVLAAVGCGSSHHASTARIAVGGGDHDLVCALTAAGGVKCWGGESGADSTLTQLLTHNATPTAVAGLPRGATQVSAGGSHACALVSGGVECWGTDASNDFLPLHGRNNRAVAIAGLTHGVQQVSVGGTHICAVVSGGAKCLGVNGWGELGHPGTPVYPHKVIDVTGLTKGVTGIAAGGVHTCALVSGGVKCWGQDTADQLGSRFRRIVASATPVAVPGLGKKVTQIAAGDVHTCALVSGGVKCWGDNSAGELGNRSSSYAGFAPVSVSGLTARVEQISAGSDYACALLVSGTVQCWGANDVGQLGIGTKLQRHIAVAVHGLTGVTEIAAGGSTTCALTKSGAVDCWGGGPLGDGTGRGSLVPVRAQALG